MINLADIEWDAPAIDIIDSLIEYYAEKRPHLTGDQIRETAERHFERSAEPLAERHQNNC